MTIKDEIIKKGKRSLTWKYFWKQKWEETSKVLLAMWVIMGIAGVVIITGYWIGYFVPPTEGLPPKLSTVIKLTIIFGINILSWIIYGLYRWVNGNWIYAKERVEEEFKCGRSWR